MPLGAVWSKEEDDLLQELVEEYGPKKWSIIAAKLRTKGSKQCRRRWKNYLNVELKSGGWTQEEDDILIAGHKKFGNKWTEIAKLVGGRTDNAVKNRWAALCKRTQKIARGIQVRTRKQRLANGEFAEPTVLGPTSKTGTLFPKSPTPATRPPLAPGPAPAAAAAPTISNVSLGIRKLPAPLATLSPATIAAFQSNPLEALQHLTAAAQASAQAQQLAQLNKRPRPVTLDAPPNAKRPLLSHLATERRLKRNGSSMSDGARTPNTPKLLQQAEEAAKRQAKVLVKADAAEKPGLAKPSSPSAIRKPDLSVIIPNAASFEPQQQSQTVSLRVFKDLLTPAEIQYAKELNGMNIPLNIDLVDCEEPPLSTSRRATQNALNALSSPGNMGALIDWFHTGLTPREASAPAATAVEPLTARRPPSARQAAQQAKQNAAVVHAATNGNSTSHAQGAALGFEHPALHQGHRQLLVKVLSGASSPAEGITSPGAQRDNSQQLTRGGSRLRNGTKPAVEAPALFLPASPGMAGLRQGSFNGMVESPGLSQHDLDKLLEALCSEEMDVLPPAPLA